MQHHPGMDLGAVEICELGGVSRRVVGAGLAVLGLGLIAIGLRLDWGVAVTCVLPGLMLCFPAGALLLGRSRWRAAGGSLLDLTPPQPLAGCSVELLPTAGLLSVVLHRPDAKPVLLGAWLSRGQAAGLTAWLDRQAGSALPRHEPERARWDR